VDKPKLNPIVIFVDFNSPKGVINFPIEVCKDTAFVRA
jgi:hypothetical protein